MEMQNAFVGYVIEKATVEAVGYDGEPVIVEKDTADMFVCCTCSEYCVCAYYGDCDNCGAARCANCARGGALHPSWPFEFSIEPQQPAQGQ